MADATTKLGLILPAGGEDIDVNDINNNSIKIDKSMGGFQVNNDVVPPDTDLYPGCMVYEKGTGCMWMAIPNGTGGFTKKWVYSPPGWGEVTRSGQPIPSQISGTPIVGVGGSVDQNGWTALGNAVGASGCRPAVKGFYLCYYQANFPAIAATDGHRMICVMKNGASISQSVISTGPTGSTAVSTQLEGSYMVEDTTGGQSTTWQIGLRQHNGSSTSLSVDFYFKMVLYARTG